jgi:hypothetical protein
MSQEDLSLFLSEQKYFCVIIKKYCSILVKAAMSSERMLAGFSNEVNTVEYLWLLFDPTGIFTYDFTVATFF